MPIELVDNASPRTKKYSKIAAAVAAGVLLLGGVSYLVSSLSSSSPVQQPEYLQCKQPDVLAPKYDTLGLHSSSKFLSEHYKKHSSNLLSQAVQIPTVSYDDMSFDVAEDPRYEVFSDFHNFLAEKFPLLSAYVEKVNTYGLLYTIPGSNPDLKPVLLMAHQDVVPVPEETLDQWTEPPFAGVIDGDWILGRGSSDTKNSLMAICEAVEALLSQHFSLDRTLLISFGFDEESQGWRGARKLSERIEEKFGKDSVEFLVDEGVGMFDKFGSLIASPAVTEKGRINFKVTLNTPGGHSSMPPDHTGIGIMSELVTELEADAPFPADMRSDVDAVRGFFPCVGHHAQSLPSDLKSVLPKLGNAKSDQKLAEFLAQDRILRTMVETTQAIDIIHGGVKINALPEEVVLEVNYRVKPASSVQRELDRFVEKVKNVAHSFDLGANLQMTFWGEKSPKEVVSPPTDAKGSFLVEVTDWLDVAPMSPFYNSTHWDIISGTTKHVVEGIANSLYDNKEVVMAPSLMTGNTDTAHYWNLTESIYRYTPMVMDDMRNIHTVNEGVNIRGHLSTVAFFYDLVINAQK